MPGTPSPPKPPALPSKDDAAKSILNSGMKRRSFGFKNTILGGGTLGRPNNGGSDTTGQ